MEIPFSNPGYLQAKKNNNKTKNLIILNGLEPLIREIVHYTGEIIPRLNEI